VDNLDGADFWNFQTLNQQCQSNDSTHPFFIQSVLDSCQIGQCSLMLAVNCHYQHNNNNHRFTAITQINLR